MPDSTQPSPQSPNAVQLTQQPNTSVFQQGPENAQLNLLDASVSTAPIQVSTDVHPLL